MNRSRFLIATGYWLAALLVLLPLIQALTTLLPLQTSDLRWRLEAFGVVVNGLLLPILGTAVATGTAVLLRHRAVVRVLSVLWGLAGITVAAAAVVFALDMVQYQGAVSAELRGPYATTGGSYLVAALLQTSFLLWLAAAGWRAARRVRSRNPSSPHRPRTATRTPPTARRS